MSRILGADLWFCCGLHGVDGFLGLDLLVLLRQLHLLRKKGEPP